jgi:hypothetical protein
LPFSGLASFELQQQQLSYPFLDKLDETGEGLSTGSSTELDRSEIS